MYLQKRHICLLGILLLFLFGMAQMLVAQDETPQWMRIHTHYDGVAWHFPYEIQQFSHYDFSADRTTLRAHRLDEDPSDPFATLVPFNVDALDSITFASDLAEKGKDKYRCFAIYITTANGLPIDTKEEYVNCYVSVDGAGQYADFSAPARIRGRGNSTWLWYDKKPYRLKLDTSHKLLGMDKNKDWVLLANYRDVTDMMNVYASITAKSMGIPFTTPVRMAELFINGEYMGIYQVAEQVEVGTNRVDIDEVEGVLLTLDVDDGPAESPGAGNNFWTKIYNMPMAVKSPKDIDAERLNQIREDFAELERAVRNHDYALCDSLMDIPSFIAMLQLQEFLYNVELAAPRSIYLFRDKDGKYTFGPAWDWDAGYDFNWSDMMTGHTFFEDYSETLFGTNPVRQNGTYTESKFFTDLFGSSSFVRQYKETWASIAPTLYTENWAETQKYVDGLIYPTLRSNGKYTSPVQREAARWPLKNFSFSTELNKMKDWLRKRLAYLTPIIAAYPVPNDGEGGGDPIPGGYTLAGTIAREYDMPSSSGYSQAFSVSITRAELAQKLGISAASLNDGDIELVPLDTDGTEGTNTAAGTYGAWFSQEGNTIAFSTGQQCVYLESNELYSLHCGCESGNFTSGMKATVTMQYRHRPSKKAVNLSVTFTATGRTGWPW